MNDLELKNLVSQACPVRPGQERRAWSALQARLTSPSASPFTWLFSPTSRFVASAGLAAVVALAIFDLGVSMRPHTHALAFADSQVPGIYATSFYSNSAQAQVIWLNGMEPASDKPTYLDPTTPIRAPREAKAGARSPDSL